MNLDSSYIDLAYGLTITGALHFTIGALGGKVNKLLVENDRLKAPATKKHKVIDSLKVGLVTSTVPLGLGLLFDESFRGMIESDPYISIASLGIHTAYNTAFGSLGYYITSSSPEKPKKPKGGIKISKILNEIKIPSLNYQPLKTEVPNQLELYV